MAIKKKRPQPGTPKKRSEILPEDSQGLLVVKYGIPDLAKKKKKARVLTDEGTQISTDEEVYFSIQKPGANNVTVKVEAYFANVSVNGFNRLALNVFPAVPVTDYFSVPYGSGYFDGNEAIVLEDEWTTITFELDGEVFEEEEQGNTLLVILVRGAQGNSPTQTVYQGALIYSVLSPYLASNKPKPKPKKTRKA